MAPREGHNLWQICSGMQSFRHYNKFGHVLEQTLEPQAQISEESCSVEAHHDDDHVGSENTKHPTQRVYSTVTDETTIAGDDDFYNQNEEAKKDAHYSILSRLGHIHQPDNDSEKPGSDESIVVRFVETDPFNPQNWSQGRKWFYTAMVGAVGLLTSGAAAIESGMNPQAAAEFHQPQIIELLSTAIFMISFGLGTLISAPFSETLGRNPVYLAGLLFFMAWTIGAAAAPNIETQLVMRFLMGLFGSPPAVTFGGSISDLWSPLERVYIFPILSFLTFLGPFLAPVVASYVATSPFVLPAIHPSLAHNWHFVEWLVLMMSFAVFVGIAFFVRETYAPVLLSWKARHIRRITGDERYKAPVELNHPGLAKSLLYSLKRPWIFLCREPIVALFSLYLIIIYIVLFGSLVAYNYIFGREGDAIYYLSQREVGLCYLPLNLGFLFAMAPLPWLYNRYKIKLAASRAKGVERLQPEEHLWFAMIGAPFLPLSLIWLAFSSKPDISYWSSLVASALFGFSSLCIFITCYQYIIDSYEEFAASALVGMTFTRYVASAPIVVAADYMYASMGVQNAELVWFAISAVMCVVPYLFYWYGPYIRLKSTRATNFGTEYGKPEPKRLLQKVEEAVVIHRVPSGAKLLKAGMSCVRK